MSRGDHYRDTQASRAPYQLLSDGSEDSKIVDDEPFSNPETRAGIVSTLLFTWITPLLATGLKRPLQIEDLQVFSLYSNDSDERLYKQTSEWATSIRARAFGHRTCPLSAFHPQPPNRFKPITTTHTRARAGIGAQGSELVKRRGGVPRVAIRAPAHRSWSSTSSQRPMLRSDQTVNPSGTPLARLWPPSGDSRPVRTHPTHKYPHSTPQHAPAKLFTCPLPNTQPALDWLSSPSNTHSLL